MIKKIIIITLTLSLLIPAGYATGMEITSEVTDKTIWDSHGHGACYCIHTEKFGDISVDHRVYEKILIGDNITFNTESDGWGDYTILRINGAEL